MRTRHPIWTTLLGAIILVGCSNFQGATPEEVDAPAPAVLDAHQASTADAFAFLQPLASKPAPSEELDRSLLDLLIVDVCDVADDACRLLATFDADGDGPERLRLEDDEFYLVNWSTHEEALSPESTQRIRVHVAGIEIGSLEVAPEVRGDLRRTWPIAFHVANHPLFRVRVLNARGFTAPEVARVLLEEFASSARRTAQLLIEDLDPYTASDVARSLEDVYHEPAHATAKILKDLDLLARDVAVALGAAYGLEDGPTVAIALQRAGFTTQEMTDALHEALDLAADAIAVSLEGAGFTASAIANALEEVLETSVDAIVDALDAAGFSPREISDAFAARFRIGEVHEIDHNFGTYHLYVPQSHTEASRVLFVVHGTPAPAQDVVELAATFIARWTDFAEEKSLVIVSLAFNRIDFGSHDDGRGGYRGLFGRAVGADQFLHGVFEQVGSITPIRTDERRFFLYGHSAGGQFANRYVVRHPDRVLATALSAPGRYAFPDPDAVWPFGMKRLNGSIEWKLSGETYPIDVTPDPDGWAKAANAPITVMVGTEDTDELGCLPAQCDPSWGGSANRKDVGRRWVDAMNALAAQEGAVGRARFFVVHGVGHSSAGLTEEAQKTFTHYLTPRVPRVTGKEMRVDEALEALAEVALHGQVAQQRLSRLARGLVIAQTPAAHTVVERGSTVFIDVSLGVREPEDPSLVPKVLGMSDTDAHLALVAEGFTVSIAFADDDRPFGEVIAQDPGSGTPIADSGREIHLVVSQGSTTTP